jgi:cation diffusion facilitator CzcD-associated flavoprotein CzcO
MICDVAVVGAGPYGLSTAAHLRAVNGRVLRVFGEPMSFWQKHMPNGMFLRSPLVASNLSDPAKSFELGSFASAHNNSGAPDPLPLDQFIEYGRWFRRNSVPDVDTRNVTRIECDTDGFQLTLADGEKLKSRRVVVAAGIVPFARRLSPFADLPSNLASHSCDHRFLDRFAGMHVAVMGGGQSALESAALLYEAGAKVSVFIRDSILRYLRRHPWTHRGLLGQLLYAPADVGPAGLSQLVAAPKLFRCFPRELQNLWATRSIRPAGAAWLEPRLQKVEILTGRWVESAVPVEGGRKLKIRLNDGTARQVDHILQATGYQVDISKYPFLEGRLLEKIRKVDGFPVLDQGFESSVPGLHFLGAPAAWSFGPLMRFVAGVGFAARAVTRRICG